MAKWINLPDWCINPKSSDVVRTKEVELSNGNHGCYFTGDGGDLFSYRFKKRPPTRKKGGIALQTQISTAEDCAFRSMDAFRGYLAEQHEAMKREFHGFPKIEDTWNCHDAFHALIEKPLWYLPCGNLLSNRYDWIAIECNVVDFHQRDGEGSFRRH